MERNELIQWSVVGVIVLLALVWAAVKIFRVSGSKNSGGCSCCSDANQCKAKDLKDEILRRQSENCHGGRSARN